MSLLFNILSRLLITFLPKGEHLSIRWRQSPCAWETTNLHIYITYRRRQWHSTLVLLPGKFHGWRSLVGCNPWGRWGSDTTERLHFHFSLSCIGEGNGKPLQCSCLENPRDGGSWWAAVSGVAQRRIRLKRLSSSSITAYVLHSAFKVSTVLWFCWFFLHLHLDLFHLLLPELQGWVPCPWFPTLDIDTLKFILHGWARRFFSSISQITSLLL